MPGKTARALCPVCQEPMPPDETECGNCGAFVIDEAVVRLSRAFGIPREKALALFEKGFRHPKQLRDRDVDDVLERGENGLLFLCTNCGGFVATGDLKCPRCDAEFEAEAPTETAPVKDILDLVLCPVCGADNEPSWKECEICGEPLGGTEEPPGALPPAVVPSATAEAPHEPPPASGTETPPPLEGLDRIDDILKDLEIPPVGKVNARVRAVQKIPKLARKPAPSSGPPRPKNLSRGASPLPRKTPAPRPANAALLHPVERRAIRPVARPKPAKPAPTAGQHGPPSHSHPRRVTFVSTRTRPRRRTAPPPEFTGGLVLAAAAVLYVSVALRQTEVAWGVAGVVLLLVLVMLVFTLSRRQVHVGRTDALLLAGGAALGSVASAFPGAGALVASLGGALALAAATRRLLASEARDLLVAASGIPLVVLGVVAALGLGFASTTEWTFGLLAAAPWPAAVAAEGLRQRHTTAKAHRELAKAERDLAHKDYAESVKDFDRAIALSAKGSPGEELPWYGKGASLILMGRYEEALRAIDRALDLNPRNEVAWLNKGNALTKMGRLIDALRCFNAAIKVNPAYEVAWNNKGNALARLGHLDEALACYERALEIDSDYRGAWVNKGYVLTKLGRYDEATSCADRVLRLNEGGRPHAV